MSTSVANQASVPSYVPGDAAGTGSTPSTTTVDAAAAASVRAWEKEQAKEARDELQRGIVGSMGQSYVDSDDDEAKDAKRSVTQGARQAGVSVTDKGLRTMDHATQSHPGTRELVDKLKDPNDKDTQQLKADLADGKAPNLAFMQQAYLQSPAPSLPTDEVGGGVVPGASDTEAQVPAAAPSKGAADAGTLLPAQKDLQVKMAAGNASSDPAVTLPSPVDGPSGGSNTLLPAQKELQKRVAAGSPSNDVAVPINAPVTSLAATPGPGSAAASNTSAAGKAASATTQTSLSTPGLKHLVGGNWNTYVAMAMYNSTKELQLEKKGELNQIKKYNAMLDAVNTYVSNVLMPAQQELQSRVAKTKDKDKAGSLEVTIYSPLRNIDTTDCDQNESGGAVLIQKAGTADPPVAEKVTQVSLTSMIGEADQWRQSISNNQQLHSSNYQSLDTQVTSNLNMITALFKNVNETQTGIVRNLPT